MTRRYKYSFWAGLFIGVMLAYTLIGACSNTTKESVPSGRIDVIDSYTEDYGRYQILKVDGEFYVANVNGGITPLIKK